MDLRRPSLLAAACMLATVLPAQTPQLAPAPDTANPNQQFTRAAQPGGVALSPDGKLLAFTLGGRGGATIHLLNVADPDPAKERLVTPTGPGGASTACSSASPVWSPDSATLAFLATCTHKEGTPAAQDAQPEIYLWSLATGETRQLTHLKGELQQLAWSPDGKSIAFLFVENATRSAGALDAMPPWNGVIGEDGVEIQRVYGVPIASGTGQWISPPSLHVYEFAYNPAKPEVTYIAANPPGENTWWIAKLYTQSLYSLSASKPIVVLDPVTVAGPLHGLQIAVPRFSPDGKQIAFIGGLMSDQGSTGGDIWVVPSTGGQPTDITPSIDGTPTYLAWTGNDNIGFVEDRSGHTLLADYTVSTRKQDAVNDLGESTVSGGPIKNAIGVSTRGTLAFVKSGLNASPEIFAGPFASSKQLTHLNDNAPKSTTKVESIEWTSPVNAAGGPVFHVQGWLTYPAHYDPGKKYPLIVTVHGGPSASAGPPRGISAWSQLGYFEFAPNPRGSFGQGEAFVQANRQDFGYGDLRDILAGMDALEAKLPIDKTREGLTGWSYGGFMTMFAVTQTHRFRAAVAGAGISDWLSYYGENSIDQWMVPFFGKTVYDDPKVYEKSSAITYIKNATTPTLVIVGDRDGECPAPQSFEFWHALRAQGTPTQLVVYPNEGHGFRDPAHIRDRADREAKWFAKYMPANGQ
jgi:dipeptidyl aminopeptidase/acylaminoacyl peptidase